MPQKMDGRQKDDNQTGRDSEVWKTGKGTVSFFTADQYHLWSEQQFLLERNFYYKERSTRLVNIRDGEELSVEYGDLDMLLGNVSAGAYENTFCIGQEQSVPGRELGVLLEDERSNLAQTGSGDFPLSDNWK